MHRLTINVNIDNGYQAHNILSLLSEKLEKYKGTEVVIDFKNVEFVAANQFAVLSAVFDDFCNVNGSKLTINNLSNKLEMVMKKNGFGRMLGLEHAIDNYHTTIPHKCFHTNEIVEFERYLLINIFQRDNLPAMTNDAQNAIIDNVLEVFNNVKEHTTTSKIYACGQFFPRSSYLYFSIVDIGETIKYNVMNYLQHDSVPVGYNTYIQWAMKEGNSTRGKGTPGGLGLSVLSKFISLNRGELYIVSDDECYEFSKGKERYGNLEHKFKGTIVTISINMNDNFVYLTRNNDIEQIIF